MPWPIYISKGGSLFSFCPGKARWDGRITGIYQMLLLTAQTGNLPFPGSISEQPDWMIDLLSWFLPKYEMITFVGKVTMVLGDNEKNKTNNLSNARQRFKK